MTKVKLFAALAAVLVAIIVVLQNTEPVTTHLLFVTLTIPNAVLVGLALLIGLAAGIILALAWSRRRQRQKEQKPRD